MNYWVGRKKTLMLLSALGLGVGATEALFVLIAKSGLSGSSLPWSWVRILAILCAVVTARSFLQIWASNLELKTVFNILTKKRRRLLKVLEIRSVPAYRNPWRDQLTSSLRDSLENLGQGMTAGFRCLAAAAQAILLVPLLLLFSWKLAISALLLAIPALLVSRLRAKTLASTGGRFEQSQLRAAMSLSDFENAVEAQMGNGRIGAAVLELDHAAERHGRTTCDWESAKAIFPPALEWFFFMTLALIALLAASFNRTESQSAVSGLLPFGALLLLIYRPIREWARHYPLYLLGTKAENKLRNVEETWMKFPIRHPFMLGVGSHIHLSQIQFGYAEAPHSKPRRLILDEFKLDLDPSAFTWITGSNGSGKSTLLKLLAGIENPQAGEIRFPQELLVSSKPMSYLSQKTVVEPDWLIWQREYRSENPRGWQKLNSILGLDEILEKHERKAEVILCEGEPLKGLSGGEKQRLCLARVFASLNPYLLLDEPTTWLSAHDRVRILGDLLVFWREGGVETMPGSKRQRGALIVSHEVFIGEFCSQTYPMVPMRLSQPLSEKS